MDEEGGCSSYCTHSWVPFLASFQVVPSDKVHSSPVPLEENPTQASPSKEVSDQVVLDEKFNISRRFTGKSRAAIVAIAVAKVRVLI
ncbi:hypothetical protein Nepgr_029958 [Nepenthes gracilis]|uniref:Uncharacterized protein n=1 Tax=Nepenthes gracilis TaxID=150966 RepID=A0AAD3TDP0_NEPGR|nr:hypothetical protein Nepgr_029958 [Nepenthes gracilis]